MPDFWGNEDAGISRTEQQGMDLKKNWNNFFYEGFRVLNGMIWS